jgi:hypothetical protein
LDPDPFILTTYDPTPATESSPELKNEFGGQRRWFFNQQKCAAPRDVQQCTTVRNHDDGGSLRFAPDIFPMINTHVAISL